MRIASAMILAACGCATLAAATASAQAPYPNHGFEPAGYSQVSSQTAASVQPPPPVAVQTRPMGKPFSSYRAQSTISPYLRLDYLETETSTPNYYMFVRPAIDQGYVNREQANENRALRSTVRQASAGGAVTSPAGGIPTTGHSSQFMNGGGYYPMAR